MEVLIFAFCLIVAFILFVIINFNPKFEFIPEGDLIMWYNSGGRYSNDRDFIIIIKSEYK